MCSWGFKSNANLWLKTIAFRLKLYFNLLVRFMKLYSVRTVFFFFLVCSNLSIDSPRENERERGEFENREWKNMIILRSPLNG